MARFFFLRASRSKDAFYIPKQQDNIDKMIAKKFVAIAFKGAFKPAVSSNKHFGLVAKTGILGNQSLKLKKGDFDETAGSKVLETMARERRANLALAAAIGGAGLLA